MSFSNYDMNNNQFDGSDSQPQLSASSSSTSLSSSLFGEQTERQLIESRINLLFKCLQEVEVLRSDTDILRRRIKENLNYQSFESIRTKLSQLETQLFNRLDKKLFQSQIDMPLKSLEFEMHQLINNLSSATMFNKRDQFSILNHADLSIKQMLTKMGDIDRYKQRQENLIKMNKFNELNESLNQVLDKFKKLLEEESPKLLQDLESRDVNPDSKKMEDIKQWLLVSSNASPSTSSEPNRPISVHREEDKNSFDFVDMNSELESIEVITDFEEACNDYRYWLLDQANSQSSSKANKIANSTPFQSISRPKKTESSIAKSASSINKPSEDGFTRTFDEICSRPIDYWLLN